MLTEVPYVLEVSSNNKSFLSAKVIEEADVNLKL